MTPAMAVDGASANDFVTPVRALLFIRLAEFRRGTEQTLIARVELGRLEVEAARRRRDLVGEVAEAEGRRGRVRCFHLLGHAGPGSPASLGGRAERRRAAIDGSARRARSLGPRCLTRCTRVQRFVNRGRPPPALESYRPLAYAAVERRRSFVSDGSREVGHRRRAQVAPAKLGSACQTGRASQASER